MRRISIANLIALFVLLFLALALYGAFFATSQQQQSATPNTSSPLTTFKDLFLVAATGMISLCSAYLGAVIQSSFQRENRKREERREITNAYRAYLEKLLHVIQLVYIIKRHPGLKNKLPHNGKQYEITPQTLDELISQMPLWQQFSSLSAADRKTKEAVNAAIDAGICFLMDVNAGQDVNLEELQTYYERALREMEDYEGL